MSLPKFGLACACSYDAAGIDGGGWSALWAQPKTRRPTLTARDRGGPIRKCEGKKKPSRRARHATCCCGRLPRHLTNGEVGEYLTDGARRGCELSRQQQLQWRRLLPRASVSASRSRPAPRAPVSPPSVSSLLPSPNPLLPQRPRSLGPDFDFRVGLGGDAALGLGFGGPGGVRIR